MKIVSLSVAALVVITLSVIGFCSVTTVQTGHVGVVTLFGQVKNEQLDPGMHIINPFKAVHEYDCRNKEVTQEDLDVPSQDQLTTSFDLTVKFRIDRTFVGKTFAETGKLENVISTHLIPQIRSTFRERGNSVANAEEFYLDNVKKQMQVQTLKILQDKLKDKGLLIEDVLIRKVELPKSIRLGVEQKIQQRQIAEREEEELKRYQKEQEKKIALATSEAAAAKQEFLKRKLQAEAQALEVTLGAEAKAKAIDIEGAALKKNKEVQQLRMIERWDGRLPSTLVGEGAKNLMLQLENSTKN